MALILSLETSSKNCSVSITRNGKLVNYRDIFDENYCHGEQLHTLVENLLRESKIVIQDFDAFAISAGPGSYTGLRIGAAAIKGFSFALDKPMISISTLYSMVFSLQKSSLIAQNKYDLFVPVLSSRKGEVYLAIYDDKTEIVPPTACVIESFPFLKYFQNNKICLFGPGIDKLRSTLQNKSITYLNNDYPSSKDLGLIAEIKFQNQDFVNLAYFEPTYLKPFITNS
tara:strand:+ start:7411 stop:8091 length:681 start_codon:yes stop_codon:yes gene_type:complete